MLRELPLILLLSLGAGAQGLFRAHNASMGALWSPGVSFSPVAGSYTGTQTVSIGCPHASEDAWYRTDGFPATPADTLYAGPFAVSATETVTAVCAVPGITNTPLTSSTDWKVNCAASSPQTEGAFTCASTGGVSANALSAWSLTFSGGDAIETAETTYSGAGDTGLLVICCQQGTPSTCNSCTTMDQHIAFAETPSPSGALENSEFDMQGLVDAWSLTKLLFQSSSQCQGSSSDMEINASGDWTKISVPCSIVAIDMNVGTEILAPGTYSCPSADTYGCVRFKYIIDNHSGKLYAPISAYGADTYPMVQKSGYAYFAASGQSQQDIYNTTTAGSSPASSTRTITAYVVTATEGISSYGAAAYTIH